MHDEAELSSVATQLDELASRITSIANRFDSSADEDIAIRLYEIERTLISAGRRVRSTSQLLERGAG